MRWSTSGALNVGDGSLGELGRSNSRAVRHRFVEAEGITEQNARSSERGAKVAHKLADYPGRGGSVMTARYRERSSSLAMFAATRARLSKNGTFAVRMGG